MKYLLAFLLLCSPALADGKWNQKELAVRSLYIQEVEHLREIVCDLAEEGYPTSSIAQTVWQMRREIGLEYKELTPRSTREKLYARNIAKYGDPLGPSIEYLLRRGKSFADIAESACRVGGEDLGFKNMRPPCLRKPEPEPAYYFPFLPPN